MEGFPAYKSDKKIDARLFKHLAFDVIKEDGKYIPQGGTMSRIAEYYESLDSYDFNKETDYELLDVGNYINQQDMTNDYFAKGAQVWKLRELEYKDLALVASLIGSYVKNSSHEAEVHASDYVGNIGDKISVDVAEMKHLYSSSYGYGYSAGDYHTFKAVDTSGNVYLVSTTKYIDESQVKKITGTVKDHQEFNGVKQTVLRRCNFE